MNAYRVFFAIITSLIIVSSGLFISCQDNSDFNILDGDIIFQDFPSSQSKAIQLATHSPYSHVGIVFFQKGKPFVFEAIQPVIITPLEEWINHGNDKHFVVKRLKQRKTQLNDSVITSMKQTARTHLGKDYDIYFGWSDELWYCSEYVWKIYERGAGIELCPPRMLKDFDLTHEIVKEKMAERYGTDIPFEEPVVSPADLFSSSLLETVLTN